MYERGRVRQATYGVIKTAFIAAVGLSLAILTPGKMLSRAYRIGRMGIQGQRDARLPAQPKLWGTGHQPPAVIISCGSFARRSRNAQVFSFSCCPEIISIRT